MSEVYERLEEWPRQTVLRLVKNGAIPGGEELYRLPPRPGHKSAARWVVFRERFEAWEKMRNRRDPIAGEPPLTKAKTG